VKMDLKSSFGVKKLSFQIFSVQSWIGKLSC